MAIDLLENGELEESERGESGDSGDDLGSEIDLLTSEDEEADSEDADDENAEDEEDESEADEVETPEVKAAAKSTPAELKALNRQIAQMQADLREARASERYWAEQAKASPKQEGKPAASKEPELAITPEQFLAELNANPMEALKRHGFVTRAEAARITEEREAELLDKAKELAKGMIKAERDNLTKDAQILRRYKALADDDSEMSRLTGQKAKQLIERGMPTELVLETAAEWAEAKIAAKAPAKQQQDRLKLVGRQAAPAGGRTSGNADSDESMSPLLRRLSKEWGLDEKAVRAQSKVISRRGA